VKTQCPFCYETFDVDDSLSREKVICKKCNTPFAAYPPVDIPKYEKQVATTNITTLTAKCAHCGIDFNYEVPSHIKNTDNWGCGSLIAFIGIIICLFFWPIGLLIIIFGLVFCFAGGKSNATMKARCYNCNYINDVPIK